MYDKNGLLFYSAAKYGRKLSIIARILNQSVLLAANILGMNETEVHVLLSKCLKINLQGIYIELNLCITISLPGTSY